MRTEIGQLLAFACNTNACLYGVPQTLIMLSTLCNAAFLFWPSSSDIVLCLMLLKCDTALLLFQSVGLHAGKASMHSSNRLPASYSASRALMNPTSGGLSAAWSCRRVQPCKVRDQGSGFRILDAVPSSSYPAFSHCNSFMHRWTICYNGLEEGGLHHRLGAFSAVDTCN